MYTVSLEVSPRTIELLQNQLCATMYVNLMLCIATLMVSNNLMHFFDTL